MLPFAIGLNIISKPDLIVLESQVGSVPCYKCVTFQVKSDSDVAMSEAIKDEHEADQFKSEGDVKGISTTDRLGFAATDERMQMLADIAARAVAEGTAPVIPGLSFSVLYHVSVIFSRTSI